MRHAKLYHNERPKLLADIERLGRERNEANARAQAAQDAVAEQRQARDEAVAAAIEAQQRLVDLLAEVEAAQQVEDVAASVAAEVDRDHTMDMATEEVA